MMETTLYYITNVAITLLAFIVGYKLLLRRETFFSFNRAVLLFSAVLPFILPFCGLTFHKVISVPAVTNVAQQEQITETADSTAWWPIVLLVVYAIGVLVITVRTIVSIVSTHRIISSGSIVTQDDDYKLVVVERDIAPFNWMGFVVISRKDYDDNPAAILAHERAHLRAHHSWDLLLAETTVALQWFNPASWMFKSELQAVHEYEADNVAAKSCATSREYQELLIGRVYAMSAGLLANGFTEQILKQRIIMINKKKSSSKRVLKALYMLAIVGISMLANAKTVTTAVVMGEPNDGVATIASQATAPSQAEVSETTEAPAAKVFTASGLVVDEKGVPVTGATVVQSGSKRGAVTDFDGRFSLDVDENANLQVSFVGFQTVTIKAGKSMKVVLKQEQQSVEVNAKTDANGITFTSNKSDLQKVYYVDGKEVASVDDINPERIESMRMEMNNDGPAHIYITLKK